jgi:AraC-like DNA-binding protein
MVKEDDLADQKRSTHELDGSAHPVPTPYGADVRIRPVTAPTYWRCEPGWSWHARPLSDYLLWCVLDGSGHLTVAGRRHILGAGSCVLFAPGDEPVAGHDPRRRLLVFGMHLDIGDIRDEKDAMADPAGVVPVARHCRLRDPALLTALTGCCDAGHRRGDRFGLWQSQLSLTQLLFLLWDEATRPDSHRSDAALDEIVLEIRQDPGRRWPVAELAARAALSRAQFTRRFTAHTGMPPNRFVIRARIDRARQLLAETRMSASEVAATLGYTDLAFFSRQYKQHAGHPPGRRLP